MNIEPPKLLRPKREVTGISAILLPFTESGDVDWSSFTAHVERTAEVGLIPAVNMDTGYVHLLDDETKLQVLDHTKQTLGSSPFVAGAFVGDQDGAKFDLSAYARQIEMITSHGGTPVIFQSFGLTQQADEAIIESYANIAKHCEQFIAFELGTIFAPFGKIYSLDVYRGLLHIKACMGAKHSSLHREPEWQRIMLRDETRPDFKVFTGNDWAIDMIMYGSDYLLGLSTFAPDMFAKRDAYWKEGNPAFYELNDILQYLGFFAFRTPVPGYKHTAAMFLHQRGWLKSSRTHPDSPERPESDLPILQDIEKLLMS